MPSPMITYWKLHRVPIVLALLSLAFYYTFAHYLVRTDFVKLITLFAALFFLSFKLIQFEKWNFKFLLAVGILFRLMFLWAEPNLSQDFYRFIWDGQLVRHGLNPYLEVPDQLIGQKDLIIAHAKEIHQGMGSLSARHFSNYPPLNQLIFALAALLGGKTILGSVMVMRTVIILADVGIYFFGRKLLKNLNRSPHLIFWYFLNPLIIIELTGNLHFEGVMLFFFAWSLYVLSIGKWLWAAIPYALSILVKLVPLLFLPLFLKHLGLKKSSAFYGMVLLTTLLLLAPFYTSEFFAHYSDSVGLWFSNFEFNAGLYNGIKLASVNFFEAKPWILVKVYGKITPVVVITIALLFTFLAQNQKLEVLVTSMLWILVGYYLLSTTVHPWYLAFPVFLVIFTDYRFALVWSAVAVLSYFAYSTAPFKENLWLLAIEYFAVYGFMLYEIFKGNGVKRIFYKNSQPN